MVKLIVTYLLITFIGLSLCDPERPGRYLEHDRTVISCAKYKREANQHQCVLSPFNTEGPFYLPDDHERSDITDSQEGIILDLTINVVNSNDCNPLENMYVHLWHTNATGKYSGVNNGGPPPPPPSGQGRQGGQQGNDDRRPPGHGSPRPYGGEKHPGEGGRPTPVSDERFLRGYQVTDSNGQVKFRTIIPGWYNGRCLHMHIEVYPKNSTEREDILYVGQIFFKSELPNELKLIGPYSSNTQRITLNENDGIFRNHGDETILNLVSQGSSYSSVINFGIDPQAKVSPQ